LAPNSRENFSPLGAFFIWWRQSTIEPPLTGQRRTQMIYGVFVLGLLAGWALSVAIMAYVLNKEERND